MEAIKIVDGTVNIHLKECMKMSTILHYRRELRHGKTGNTNLLTQTIF